MDQKVKTLIVEDEELIRMNLRAMLEDLGYSVIEAANGKEGLDVFDREQPDIILADLRMPVMDGITMISRLKDKSDEIPIIVISGTGNVRDAVTSLRLGAWDYIIKPVSDADGMDIVIRRTIEKSNLIKENRLYREHLEEMVQTRTNELLESETRYRRLLESVISYVYTVIIKDRVPVSTVHSQGCEAVTGFSPREYEDDKYLWLRMIHSDDKSYVLDMSQKILDGSLSLSFEHRIHHKDGAIRWVHNTLVPHTTVMGELLSYDGIVVDITDRKLAEIALQESEAKLRSIVDNIGIGISLINTKMEVLEINQRMRHWFPRVNPAQHPVCYNAFYIPPRENVCDNCPTWKTLQDGLIHDVTMQRPVGSTQRTYRHVSSPLLNARGEVTAAIELIEDITERIFLETQLLQAQKMEAVGRLAGGIAHDFNNMLNVVIGYTELSLDDVDKSSPIYNNLQEIRKVAGRTSDLTHQLLAFAHKETLNPRVLDLNETVEGILKMLRHMIGEDIDLAWIPEGVCTVKMDPTQIDQILANLCVNARDAIAGVGNITIKTHTETLNEDYGTKHPGFIPGDYVLLAVSDNGCGMDKETIGKIFEPFFTTKETGKGTGIGLATVYGIIKQNKGFINVYSEPGHGTTFNIYLPLYTTGTEVKAEKKIEESAMRGHETVLLVEDEEAILDVTKAMLEKLGYRVLITSSPDESFGIAEKHADEIRMLITDVVMPEMNGPDLAEKLISLYPGLKVLFMSGYTGNVIARYGIQDKGVNFIHKPFSRLALASKIREILDT
jgi:two-component system, cell cycle sensor histidine kinase and response regulator CckA